MHKIKKSSFEAKNFKKKICKEETGQKDTISIKITKLKQKNYF